jgi:hypothetical protein
MLNISALLLEFWKSALAELCYYPALPHLSSPLYIVIALAFLDFSDSSNNVANIDKQNTGIVFVQTNLNRASC